MLESPFIWTGYHLVVLVPSPSLPSLFAPQAHSVPSSFTAIVNPAPVEIALTLVISAIMGILVNDLAWSYSGLSPSPICPESVNPHNQTVLFFLKAATPYTPVDIALTSSILTCTGRG